MKIGELGKVYQKGEIIVKQGDEGKCMYVIQEGQVEVVINKNGREEVLSILEAGNFFGEMAIFDHEDRSATVRALSMVRVLTVEKKNFLARITQDPSLAFRIVHTMSTRIRDLDKKIAEYKNEKYQS